MGYVAKGSPQGYDIDSLVDYLQSFNSGWPLLKLQETGNFSGTINHGLGYTPFFIVTSPTFTAGAVDSFAEEYGVDASVLARTGGSGTPRYFIFRLDITTNYTAPTPGSVTSKDSSSNDYVFKITKEGTDVNSTDMRNFALHSGTKSPMLHSVNHGTCAIAGPLGYRRTVTHNLGYIPTVFVFFRPGVNTLGMNTSRYCTVPPPVGVSYGYYTVTTTQVIVDLDTSMFSFAPDVSVVIIKDPFDKETVARTFP